MKKFAEFNRFCINAPESPDWKFIMFLMHGNVYLGTLTLSRWSFWGICVPWM